MTAQYAKLCDKARDLNSKSTGGLSDRSFNSETNNLVEELFLDTSCSANGEIGKY